MDPNQDYGRLNINLAFVTTTLIISLLVLFLSITKAGLEITAAEDKSQTLRKNEVEFTVVFADESTQPFTYKFPEINTLPSSPFYGFKRIRDWLWLQLSQGNINKARIALVVADKKMMEAGELFDSGKPDLAIESGLEAISKLKYSNQLIEGTDTPEAEKLSDDIFKAGFAYGEVLKGREDVFNLDAPKFNQLVSEVNSWNESQKTKKENTGN